MPESKSEGLGNVWILVDHSAREASFQVVAEHLRQSGAGAEVVTLTEVLGSAARGAISGGAERLLRGLRVALQGKSDEDFLGAVRRARPDVLAITDPRFLRALGLLETMSGIGALQIGVMPDYNLSPEWQKSGLQSFIVPHESFREKLSSKGVAPERIIVAGPPIQARFETTVDRNAVRTQFAFQPDEKIILVRADGIDPVWLDKVVFQATLVTSKTRFIFHHNGDAGTASTLRRAAQQFGLRALMFGNVADLERYVTAADLVICASREALVAEIVALDRPILFVGDESGAGDQIEFLKHQGAARHVGDVLRLGTEVDAYLVEDALRASTAAAEKLSATHGSKDVANALLVALQKRQEWLTPAAPAHPVKDAPPHQPPVDPVFEEIGASTQDQPAESDFTGIGMAEARDQLARLILDEREIERRLDDSTKQQDRWRSRLNLAREWNETDLAAEAESILRGHRTEADRLATELQKIRQQKLRLKVAAHGKTSEASAADAPPDVENRFRKMEMDSDLQGLKDRIRRELGE